MDQLSESTRGRIIAIRAAEPRRKASSIARELDVSRERVRQLLVSLGMETRIRGRSEESLQKARIARREKNRRPEVRAHAREQRRLHPVPDQLRMDRWYRSQYGVSWEQYHLILEEQGGGCALCGCGPDVQLRRMHLDHDHSTGKVRGVLCTGCNTFLGRVEKAGKAYMERLRLYVEGRWGVVDRVMPREGTTGA